MVFGVGKLGGALVDVLALKWPQHKYVLISRSTERAERRANLTRYVCSLWGAYPTVDAGSTDLLDRDRTAALIEHHHPDLVFNATTPFAWWAIDELPALSRKRIYSSGLGMWCALDCVLPMGLDLALRQVASRPTYVNACYPDMVNRFLGNSPACPVVGVGNISNLVPGLRLAFGKVLSVAPREVGVQLVCHHFTSLNAPTRGGACDAPYDLTVNTPHGDLSFGGTNDEPFAHLKQYFTRVRGLDGQGVTVASAATVVASLVNGTPGTHHVPGPLGLVGGYPVTIDACGGVALDLPERLSPATAVAINETAQRSDGIHEVVPGKVLLTDHARDALAQVVGLELPTLTYDNARSLAGEIIERLNRRYGLELRL